MRRKQKKLTVKAKKQKKAKAKSSDASGTPVVVSTSSASQTQKGSRGISSEKEGKMLFSKFEIPKSSQEKDTHKSKLVGKDYKRLLMKLEQRDAKIAKVKEKDPAAATKLEEKYVWQVCAILNISIQLSLLTGFLNVLQMIKHCNKTASFISKIKVFSPEIFFIK